MTTTNLERRIEKHAKVELRAASDGKPVLTGHAPVFNKLSQNMGGWVERNLPGCCDVTARESDVRGLFNHDPTMLLGRRNTATGVETMTLTIDEVGVRFDIALPDTQLGNDLRVMCERGDIDGASHSFNVMPGGVIWGLTDDDFPVRDITAMRLFDVGPVTFPAFLDSDASMRAEQRSAIFAPLAAELGRPLEEVLDAADGQQLRDMMTDSPETHERLRETRRSVDNWANRARLDLEAKRYAAGELGA